MAAHDDAHYTHGEMEISDQKATYEGFMAWTVWGCSLTAAIVLFLTLVFAAGQPWLASLFGVAALAIVAGLGMRLGAAWFATVVGLLVVGLISGGVATLVSSAL
jgi:hypothetical protein